MLGAIREDVTRTLAFATFTFQQPDLPDMPDFVTHHIDPFTGEDDSADLDAATGNVLSRLPPLQVPRPEMPGATAVAEKLGRASRRERVCQSVWISVVAVSLNTQKYNMHTRQYK